MSAVDVLTQNGIRANADAVVNAASRTGVPLWIAAAFVQQETGGYNIYGHDGGGAMAGAGEVTSGNFARFISLISKGHTSNGVGPLQITYGGYFSQAAAQGLRLWVPEDNIVFGLNIIKGYLGGATDDGSINAAAQRYNSGSANGAPAYGASVLSMARRYHAALGNVSTRATGNPATQPAQDLGSRLSIHDRKLLQAAVGTAQDGDIGPKTIKALQGKFGVMQDGFLSAPTSSLVMALQKLLNSYVGKSWCGYAKLALDGDFGQGTARALSNYLNSGHGAFGDASKYR